MTIAAGVAIVFTGRYPRPLFDFNVGVLRWSWRLMNYRFPMNSTDKYPPFTLALGTGLPGRPRSGLPGEPRNRAALLQTLATGTAADTSLLGAGAISATLCVVNAVWLLCIGTINQGMFDLLMGIVRWRYRVAVYVSLMRDEYPPFRMDLGSVQVGHGAP